MATAGPEWLDLAGISLNSCQCAVEPRCLGRKIGQDLHDVAPRTGPHGSSHVENRRNAFAGDLALG